MADSTTMMYIVMGVVNVVLFIVVGSFMVLKQRRRDAWERTSEVTGFDSLSPNLKLEDDEKMEERMRKIAKSLEDTLDNPRKADDEAASAEGSKNKAEKKED